MKKILLIILGGFINISIFSQNTQSSIFVNTGKLYVAESSSTDCTLYINGDFKVINNSEIHQKGTTVLTGDFQNNVIQGNVFVTVTDEIGNFEFRGEQVQHIKGTANKGSSFIKFPHLVINNQTSVQTERDTAAVIISSNIGVETEELNMEKGRLILESEETSLRGTQIAHLLVNNSVTYPDNNESRPLNEKAIIQVKLDVGEIYKERRLIGFTPPFNRIYTDYFFYNFVTRPTSEGLFGDKGLLITNPKIPLESGKGYLIGLSIVPEGDPYYTKEWDSKWNGANFNDRITTKMSFARDFAPTSLTKFVNEDNEITDKYSAEKIRVDNVEVEIEEGWNYLGNPYTVPIDMSTFLKENTTADNWGVVRGTEADCDVENKYYILSQGTGTYEPEDEYEPFKFNVTYLIGQEQGETITQEGTNSALIAPMQLFVIKKNKNSIKNSIIIPKEIRTHGKVEFMHRSEPKNIYNELLIETEDIDTQGYDRLCLVFRNEGDIKYGDKYDAIKIFNKSGGVNQIYTKTSDDKKMMTNVIPTSTKKIQMFFQPSDKEQEVILKAFRQNTLIDINKVILEDTKTGIKTDLLKDTQYLFTSSPTDRTDRFNIYFSNTTDMDEDFSGDMYVYYRSEGEIIIENLQDIDLGSIISLYDIDGRIILQEKIESNPTTTISVMLNTGTYIVKVNGERNFTKKILAK